MFTNCPHCGTYAEMRRPDASVRCRFCDTTFQPSKLESLRFQRMLAERERRERLAPLNFWGSLAVVVVTAFLLGGIYSGGILATIAGWCFPVWVAALTLGIWALHSRKEAEAMPALAKTSVMVLVVLMLPLLYSGMPRGVRDAARAPVSHLTSMAVNR